MTCAICPGPDSQFHHIAKPTNGGIRLCGKCNRLQEHREQHYGAFDHGATPLLCLIEQLFSLQPTAEVDGTFVANLVALRTALALTSGERIGARPISNRTTMPDVVPRRDPEALMRELLRAMARSLEELGLEGEAKLARALSNARPSERLASRPASCWRSLQGWRTCSRPRRREKASRIWR
jgi:hypothetical protein